MSADPPAGFSIRTITDGARTIVALAGEFDIAAEDEAHAAVERALAGDPVVLIVDLRRLTFIDSTGLRVLLITRSHCAKLDCRLLLTGASPAVQRVFDISGVAEQFEMTDEPRPPGALEATG